MLLGIASRGYVKDLAIAKIVYKSLFGFRGISAP